MFEETADVAVDPSDPRIQVLVGIAVAIIAMAGLTLEKNALGLQPWARWFLMTFLFFAGMIYMMYSLSNLN